MTTTRNQPIDLANVYAPEQWAREAAERRARRHKLRAERRLFNVDELFDLGGEA